MEVKPYNILVSVSFPPDTDTPQLQEEMPHRVSQITSCTRFSVLQSKIANKIAATSGVFQPSEIANDIIKGVEVRSLYVQVD